MPEHYPLYVAIVWHMHQPYYKDIRTGKHIMPWVRLHAVKDYLDMVLLMDEYPDVRVTFNLVPSLLEQIEDLAAGTATDLAWDMTATPAAELNDAQREFIVEKFFYAHLDNMILPYPRYRELYEKRGGSRDENEIARASEAFSEQDLRDLQLWYNLAWIDPMHREHDPELRRLVDKGREFTENDKRYVLESHRQILGRIVPAYRAAAERGQIEISTTPFYHPILPLVYDTDVARRARPDIELPHKRFSSPRDARTHVQDACEYYEGIFGARPRGMWPAEGSVSPEILPLIAASGIEWIATDEEILAHSCNQPLQRSTAGTLTDPEFLYQPYYAEHLSHRVAIVFRDRFLSDLIGFQYGSWDSGEAAADLVQRLEIAAKSVRNPSRPLLVSIILDGENCWEHYGDDGLSFLRCLYDMLGTSQLVRTTRVCDFIDEFPPRQTISPLFSGSWINHDFRIWIGHREDNHAWEYLHDVREAVERHIAGHRDQMTEEQIRAAWKEIMIAEGSDWNWWYGDDHSSGIDEEFDQLFRDHLMSACQIAGMEPPSFLYIPIATKGSTGQHSEPRGFIQPVIDGQVTGYFEWLAAGFYDPTLGGGSMHQAQYLIHRLCYGFDAERVYFRVDTDHSVLNPMPDDRVVMNLWVIGGHSWRVSIVLHARRPGPSAGAGEAVVAVLERESDSHFDLIGEVSEVAAGRVVELAVPLVHMNLAAGDPIHVFASLEVNGREVERCPARSPISTRVPPADFDAKMWTV